MNDRLKEIQSIFKQGLLVFDPIFIRNGFVYYDGDCGQGSGGFFVSGMFRKESREFHLSYRYTLGNIFYRVDNFSLAHETYMKFLGVKDRSRYPSFSHDSIEIFYNLAYDIENFCQDFLFGNGQSFIKFAKQYQQNPDIFKGFNQLP